MKKYLGLAALIIMMLMLAMPVSAATTKMSKSKLTIYTMFRKQLKVVNAPKKAKIKWTSSNRKIAAVNKKGWVTGLKAGKSTITAKIGKRKYKCLIKVKQKKDAPKGITAKYQLVKGRYGYYFVGAIKNKRKKAISLEVSFNMFNKDGYSVSGGLAGDNPYFKPGETWYFIIRAGDKGYKYYGYKLYYHINSISPSVKALYKKISLDVTSGEDNTLKCQLSATKNLNARFHVNIVYLKGSNVVWFDKLEGGGLISKEAPIVEVFEAPPKKYNKYIVSYKFER